jgi:integrase
MIKEQNASTATESLVEVTLIEWMNRYLDDGKLRWSERTYKEKVAVFKRFSKNQSLSQDTPVHTITTQLALDYLQKQMRTRSGHAANKDRKNLASAWSWGVKYIPGFPSSPNPFLAVDKFPEERHPRYIPPEEDFFKVLEHAKGQDYVMLITFLHTAARRGEVFRLKWEDIDFGNDKIRLYTRKREGGSLESDWLPMTKELKQTLLWQWENRKVKSEYVFVNPDKDSPYYGQPYKYRQHFMKKICKRADVKPFGFHAIRHLTATILYKKGYPVSIIQEILRHKSPNTTERYLHRLGLTDRMKEALEELTFCKPQGKILELKKMASN